MVAKGYASGIKREKLSSGRYVYRLRLWVGGELKKGTFPTDAAAQAARDFLLARRRAESLGIPPPVWPKAEPTIESVFKAFDVRIRRMGLSEAYRKQVVGIGKLFEKWRGKSAPAVFKRQDIEEFVEWARTPGNTKSAGRQIRNSLAILRMVLRYSELPVPPTVNVAVPRRAPKTVTADQLKAFLKALPWGSVERAWAELDLRTGIRESEARGLTIGDVDLEANVIRVRHGKGRPEDRGSEELHPLPDGAAAALRAYRERQPRNLPDDAPFLAVTSRRPRGPAGVEKRRALEKGSLRRRLQAASEAAGIPARGGVGWLRHQAATLARTSGQRLRKASAALGHVDEKMVAATYDESTREAEERWAARAELGARIDAMLPVQAGFASGTKGPKKTGK